jgi:hypothetical protein
MASTKISFGTVLAHEKTGYAKTFANETQANNAACKLREDGVACYVVGRRPYYVRIETTREPQTAQRVRDEIKSLFVRS